MDYDVKVPLVFYTGASFACLPKHEFEKSSSSPSSSAERKIGFRKMFNKKTNEYVDVAYQNSSCIGYNLWEKFPECSLINTWGIVVIISKPVIKESPPLVR
jgi:hypothetical protein